MATTTLSVNIAARRVSGERQVAPTPAGASAHVTVTVDTAFVKTRADLKTACDLIADSLLPQ